MPNLLGDLRRTKAAADPDLAHLWTQAGLALRLGVNEATVRRWEKGDVLPTRRHRRALARVLGVDEADLGL